MKKEKILLHICCGPCATGGVEKINTQIYELIGFYYNPNIHPQEEYTKRLQETVDFFKSNNLKLIIPEYDPQQYFKKIAGDENNKDKRCLKCWQLRLETTAQKATELGINTIGTTLRISPYQNQTKLLKISQEIAGRYNLNFYSDDLSAYYRYSVETSKRLGMYRQKYCGCTFSKDYK